MRLIGKAIALIASGAMFVPALAVANDAAFASAERAAATRVVPKGTLIRITPLRRISSTGMKVGDVVRFRLAWPVVQDGVPLIAWGAPVKGVVSWRARRNFFGKRAKFDVTLVTLSAGGRDWRLTGRIREMSPPNTGAFGDMLVSRPAPAVIEPGEIYTVAAAEDIRLPMADAR